MGPIYKRLPNVPGVGYQATADKIGLGLAAVTGAGIAAHAIIRGMTGRTPEEPIPIRDQEIERREKDAKDRD
jgi:hypothetical protein